ncbi:hypothetical protein BKA57DRAFT_135172 [Linnemannia elongata]|nr:hypothetical protein BKA57DRAFT_135172 [Linnemannia elongata]
MNIRGAFPSCPPFSLLVPCCPFLLYSFSTHTLSLPPFPTYALALPFPSLPSFLLFLLPSFPSSFPCGRFFFFDTALYPRTSFSIILLLSNLSAGCILPLLATTFFLPPDHNIRHGLISIIRTNTTPFLSLSF